MEELTINTWQFTKLVLGTKDSDGDVEITIKDGNEYADCFIKKEEAKQIIDHLKTEFDL